MYILYWAVGNLQIAMCSSKPNAQKRPEPVPYIDEIQMLQNVSIRELLIMGNGLLERCVQRLHEPMLCGVLEGEPRFQTCVW